MYLVGRLVGGGAAHMQAACWQHAAIAPGRALVLHGGRVVVLIGMEDLMLLLDSYQLHPRPASSTLAVC